MLNFQIHDPCKIWCVDNASTAGYWFTRGSFSSLSGDFLICYWWLSQSRVSLSAEDCLENYSERSVLCYTVKKDTTKCTGSNYNIRADQQVTCCEVTNISFVFNVTTTCIHTDVYIYRFCYWWGHAMQGVVTENATYIKCVDEQLFGGCVP